MPRPGARYTVTDAVVTALLAVSQREQRLLAAAFDQLAEDPAGLAMHMTLDWDGRLTYGVRYGRFEIAYLASETTGVVLITTVRPCR